MRVFLAPRGNLGSIKGLLERGQERAAEHLGQDPHGQKEVGAGGDPVGVSGVEPTARDEAVDMGVEEQELSPRVQDGVKAIVAPRRRRASCARVSATAAKSSV